MECLPLGASASAHLASHRPGRVCLP